jgi:hypothetical protein
MIRCTSRFPGETANGLSLREAGHDEYESTAEEEEPQELRSIAAASAAAVGALQAAAFAASASATATATIELGAVVADNEAECVKWSANSFSDSFSLISPVTYA